MSICKKRFMVIVSIAIDTKFKSPLIIHSLLLNKAVQNCFAIMKRKYNLKWEGYTFSHHLLCHIVFKIKQKSSSLFHIIFYWKTFAIWILVAYIQRIFQIHKKAIWFDSTRAILFDNNKNFDWYIIPRSNPSFSHFVFIIRRYGRTGSACDIRFLGRGQEMVVYVL